MGVLESEAVVVDEVEVPYELHWIWRAFWRLTDSRSWLSGMAAAVPLPIPFRDIVTWADTYEYDEAMLQDLDACIRAMDAVYIGHMQKQAKS